MASKKGTAKAAKKGAAKGAKKGKAKAPKKGVPKRAKKVAPKAAKKPILKKAAKPSKPPVKPAVNPVLAARKAAQEATGRQKAAERLAAQRQKEVEKAAREVEQIRQQLLKERERALQAQKALGEQKDAVKKAELDRKTFEKDVERQKKEAAKRAEQERKAAEKAEAARLKQETKDAEAAAKAAAKLAGKKKPIPMSSLAAAPIFRPLTDQRAELAPLPPQAKAGHVDHQMLSAIEYGLFAAVNKTFGFAGQSVVKNAALRMLEYGYKRGWLPPKSKEPVRALNEFYGRLETMGYADKIHVAKRGESYVLEVQGLADFEAVHELRGMHYPLLPIFLGAMLEAIIDQYFQLKVTMEPVEFQEQRRGFNLAFSLHERSVAPEVSRLPALARVDDFEE
jgi:histone H1/5